jgi:tRNA threonylcarbamoyladenosine biosynthesis protein TsaE
VTEPAAPVELVIATPEEMEELGARVADRLDAGDVVLLDGELGAGKTTFTRGLGAALGVRGTVTSPTFVLARTHPRTGGGAPLVHVDAYRLSTTTELDDLDLDLDGAITVIEWGAGKAEALVDAWLRVEIDRPRGGDAPEPHRASVDDLDLDEPVAPRRVRVSGHGARWADLSWLSTSRMSPRHPDGDRES